MAYPRLTPEEVDERIAARAADYQAGTISLEVLRASFFALGKRGSDLDLLVREQERIKWETTNAHC